MKLKSRLTVLTLVFGIALFGSNLTAATITIPSSFEAVEGSSGNLSPLGGQSPKRYQVVIAQSGLVGLVPGDMITGIRFRADSGEGPMPSQTVTDYEIRLSQSQNPPGSLSTTFADNRGADEVVARTGPLTFTSADYPTGGSPNAFGKEIAFTTPYQYEGGPLLIEIAYTSFPSGGIDSDAVFPPPISTEQQYASSFSATTANQGQDSGIVVMQLETNQSQNVPALGAGMLAGLALLLAIAGIAVVRRS